VKSSQQKPETTSPAVINSSIGVLQFKEKHSNGKATSLEVLPRIAFPSITILCILPESDYASRFVTARSFFLIASTFDGARQNKASNSTAQMEFSCSSSLVFISTSSTESGVQPMLALFLPHCEVF
jgi:hypothetical protein